MKINITPYRSKSPCFAIDSEGYYVSQDVVLLYPISDKNYDENLYLWVSFLNSKLFEVLMMNVKEMSNGMRDYLSDQIKTHPIPIYDKNNVFYLKIIELTKQIIKEPLNKELEKEMLRVWMEFFELDEIQKKQLFKLKQF